MTDAHSMFSAHSSAYVPCATVGGERSLETSMLFADPDSRSYIILTLLAVASHCLGVGGIGRSRCFGVQERASCDPGLAAAVLP